MHYSIDMLQDFFLQGRLGMKSLYPLISDFMEEKNILGDLDHSRSQ